MRPSQIALAVLVMALWGFNFVPIKVVVSEIPPLFVVALRFAIVGLLLAPFVRLPRGSLRRTLLAAFVMGVLHFSFTYSGLRTIDATAAALVLQLQVPFSVLLGALLLKERFGWRTTLGIAIAFLGAVLIAGEPDIAAEPLGLVLLLGSALTWAYGNVLIKRLEDVSPLALTALVSGLAAPPVFALSFALEHDQIASLVAASVWAHLSIVYMIVAASIISYGIWFHLLNRYPVYRILVSMLLTPLFAVLSAVPILGERIGWLEGIGGALTVAGVALVVLRRAKRLKDAQAPIA